MRTRVAQNPGAPVDALREIFNTSGLAIRKSIIENAAVTRPFLEELYSLDTSDIVRNWINTRLAADGKKFKST